MKHVRQLIYLVILTCCIQLVSCRQNNSAKNSTDKLAVEVNADSISTKMDYYRFPSPDEVLGLIEESDLKFLPGIVNSTDRLKYYKSSDKQALNLGVYVSDLAYLSVFPSQEKTYLYINTISELTDNLEIEGAFSKNFVERMHNNMDNLDSLAMFSGDVFYKIVVYLENNNNESTLALISLGAFIESTYLLLNYITDYNQQEPLVQRVADQKYAFDNLCQSLLKNMDNQSEKVYIDMISEIKKVYNSIDVDEAESTVSKTKTGELVIDGGESFVLSEDILNQIKEIIFKDRKSIIE